mmetsp:Transcript_17023/g.66340  ORF Transcript_17023/g.66340 Transcript_17023/m.66340 type:complete len:282 (-) Transcript_17023:1379-2224(-)
MERIHAVDEIPEVRVLWVQNVPRPHDAEGHFVCEVVGRASRQALAHGIEVKQVGKEAELVVRKVHVGWVRDLLVDDVLRVAVLLDKEVVCIQVIVVSCEAIGTEKPCQHLHAVQATLREPAPVAIEVLWCPDAPRGGVARNVHKNEAVLDNVCGHVCLQFQRKPLLGTRFADKVMEERVGKHVAYDLIARRVSLPDPAWHRSTVVPCTASAVRRIGHVQCRPRREAWNTGDVVKKGQALEGTPSSGLGFGITGGGVTEALRSKVHRRPEAVVVAADCIPGG